MVAAMRSAARALVPAAVVIGLLVGSAVAHAAPDPWTPMASFVAATRSGESLVKLHDGSVLAIGGSSLTSVERYDPATGTWAAVAQMSTAHDFGIAVTLTDGTVLVAGGANGGTPTASAERYDPATDTWTPAASMAQARRLAVGGQLLSDGTVLVVGGIVDMFGARTANAERYDPATDSWSSAGSLSTERYFGALTLLSDGTALATGGLDSSAISASADRYDPATDSWSPAAPLPAPLYLHTATRLPDGRVLVAGGSSDSGISSSAQLYDPQAGRWSRIAPMSRPRNHAAAIPLPHDGVLMVGGGPQDDAAEIFDPASGRWSSAGGVGALLSSAQGVALDDGSALVAGGGQFGHDGAWRFSLVTTAAMAPLDFGEQTTRRLGPALSLAVRNDGVAPLHVDGVTIQGPDAGDFSVVYDQCRQGAVASGDSCLVGVRFTPSALGARAASLVVAGDVTGGSSSTPLSGVGVAAEQGVSGGPGVPAARGVPVGRAGGGTRARGVRCSARRGRAVTCDGLPSRLATARGAVVLKRGRTTFARGTLRGGTLTLNVQRRLFHARYRLVVGRGTHVRAASVLMF
jgi:Kelch motif/Galactose oxidase, central domain